MKLLAVLSVLVLASPASGREGFSLNLGLGGGFFSLDDGSLAGALTQIGRPGGESQLLTGTLSDGLAVKFSMAYLIRGYTSVEVGITGHGWNLGGGGLGGSGHVSLVAHFHPLQLWIPDRDYDATVFLGGGYSIIGGGRSNDNDSRGLDGGMFECGFTGRYFLTPWFSLGAEVRFSVPVYKHWYVDWGDNVDFSLKTAPDSFFVALLVVTGFHFSPSK